MSRNMHAVTDYNQGESIGSGGERWQEAKAITEISKGGWRL
jgi:hypothetical protein